MGRKIRSLFPRPRRSLLFFLLSGAGLGTLVGFFLGYYVALFSASNWLGQYSDRLILHTTNVQREARTLLHVIETSPYASCSDEEIAFLRKRLFSAEYVNDIGRMAGDHIICSTTQGRQEPNDTRTGRMIREHDGAILYDNLLPIPSKKIRRVGVRKGDAYVIYMRHLPVRLGPVPMEFSTYIRGNSTQDGTPFVGTSKPQLPSEELQNERTAYGNGLIYATRCSKESPICTTTFTPIGVAARAERSKIWGGMLSGLLCGTLFGVLFFLAYRRTQSLEHQLRRAIRLDKLRLVYQPVVDLADRRIVGAEALVRWTDDNGCAISPEDFVPLAEERGFINELTKLVIRHVLREFGATLTAHPDFRININVAAPDLFDPEFPAFLERSLQKAGVKPHNVGIEVTETSTARKDSIIHNIQCLRARGHRVYIDDFGTGYSSLAYLHDLSIDAIKIDRAFTHAIGTDSVTVCILPQILTMAEQLHLDVVVEGIETDEQASFFSSLQRPILGQGWRFGRPVSHREFLTLLDEDQELKETVAL